MKKEFLYDPVTAIDESHAKGEIAKIFSDIRNTMGIPLITSIWRGLAGMENNLPEVWNLTKPIYQSREPAKILVKMIDDLNLPIINTTLSSAKLSKKDISEILQIIKVYNFSNGTNLIALSALVLSDFKPLINTKKISFSSLHDKFPGLMSKNEIDKKTWNIIQRVNAFGSPSGIKSHVATLWRHLGHWPNLLTLVIVEFEKLERSGIIDKLMEEMLYYVQYNGIKLEKDNAKPYKIDPLAVTTIRNYVHTKYQVIRMVVLGNILQKLIENN